MRISTLSLAVATAALIAGCGSDSTEPQVDVDAALSQMATSGISTYTTTAAAGVTVPLPNTSAASCPYDAATKFFVCTPVTANGLTFSRQFQLLDATGAPLSTANPLAVASIRSVIDLEGTSSMAQGTPQAMTLQIDRHEDATLSGIQSTNRVLNGTATQQATVTSSTYAASSEESSVTTNLQLPSSPDQKYPLGGKITTNGSTTLSLTGTTQYTREISFDGTSFMTVKMTVGTTTTTCKINLASTGGPSTCS
jgi:hypothetical protein